MNDWWKNGVPAFVVVGRVNAGKSATLATLLEVDDDALLRVSPTPGETTGIQALPVVYNEEELIRFFDTPGFQQPVEAMREIERIAGDRTPGIEDLKSFVEQCGERFPDEVRLLAPIVQGAGILYVIDPCKPLRDSFLAEIEILRWSGRPRLALLNPQGEGSGDEEAWRDRLGAAFNLVRTFDAHSARYDERRKLLMVLLQIEERYASQIERVVAAMETEWSQRRDDAAEAMLDFLERALTLRVSDALDERDEAIHSRRERKENELTEKYFARLAKLERACVEKLLTIYRHHLIEHEVDSSKHRGLDLMTAETWRKWGLNRGQLTTAAAIAGGAAGAMIDLGFGVSTLGAGTVIGALGGGAAAYFKGGQLPELKVKLGGRLTLKGGAGKTITLGPPASINFAWILLDSMLLRYQGVLERAHGRRDRSRVDPTEGESVVRQFPAERRTLLQKWFSSCAKGTPDRGKEAEVFACFVAALTEVEQAVENN